MRREKKSVQWTYLCRRGETRLCSRGIKVNSAGLLYFCLYCIITVTGSCWDFSQVFWKELKVGCLCIMECINRRQWIKLLCLGDVLVFPQPFCRWWIHPSQKGMSQCRGCRNPVIKYLGFCSSVYVFSRGCSSFLQWPVQHLCMWGITGTLSVNRKCSWGFLGNDAIVLHCPSSIHTLFCSVSWGSGFAVYQK